MGGGRRPQLLGALQYCSASCNPPESLIFGLKKH
jgi:hypothetical protein